MGWKERVPVEVEVEVEGGVMGHGPSSIFHLALLRIIRMIRTAKTMIQTTRYTTHMLRPKNGLHIQ
jgi:hypothetical protein